MSATAKLSLAQVADLAGAIMTAHAEAFAVARCFDGGEFSRPAHATAQARELEQLARAHGFTIDALLDELFDRACSQGQTHA